jgi:hypothetical protein
MRAPGLLAGLLASWAVLSPSAWAESPSAHTPLPNQVGVVAAVQGAVPVAAANGTSRPAVGGQPVFLGDVVSTGADSRLQLLLLDETVFTVGPESAITIDRFVYDPATDAGALSAEIMRGVFRFVTGKIAHKDPEQMKVKLPSGTLGVRGTIVVGRVDGARASVALIGPGSFTVSNLAGRPQEVSVSRPGFGTVLEAPDQPPAPPAEFAAPDLGAMTASLAPPLLPPAPPLGIAREGEAPPSGGQPDGMPPPGMERGPRPGEMRPMGPMMGRLGEKLPAGPAPFGPGMHPIGPTPPPIPPNTTQQAAQSQTQVTSVIAKMDQLRSIQTGVFHYAALLTTGFHQTAPVQRSGPMELKLDIDFGARTIGGGNSALIVRSLPTDAQSIQETMSIAPQSFATASGDAIFTQTTGNLTGTFSIKNADGGVANRAKAVAVFDGPIKDGAGTIDNAVRHAGAAPP